MTFSNVASKVKDHSSKIQLKLFLYASAPIDERWLFHMTKVLHYEYAWYVHMFVYFVHCVGT